MGQKVNPISLRLQKTNRHFDSCWYDDYNYTHLFLQDYKIQKYLKTVLHQIKYPEGRVLNVGVPKKNIINLFYYNPSNSRRKKSKSFQLQNYKDNFKFKKHDKHVKSFFSFPGQQYWKSNAFILPQQQIESTVSKIETKDKQNKSLSGLVKDVYSNNSSESKEPSSTNYSQTRRSFNYKKQHQKDEKLYRQYFSSSYPKKNLYLFNTNTKSLISPQQRYNKSTTNLVQTKNSETRSGFVGIYHKFLVENSNLSFWQNVYQSVPNIDTYLLQFVVNNKGIENSNKYEKSSMMCKRFFVRYLIAQLYSNMLQNKQYSNTESYNILFKSIMFFLTKNIENNIFLSKYRKNKDLYNYQKTIYESINNDVYTGKRDTIIKRSLDETFENSGISKHTLMLKKNNPLHYPSGIYSSNTVYKTHLEYTLSKQYYSFYSLNLFRTLIEKQSASFLVQEIIHYLEKKVPFRRIKGVILREIPKYKNIKGIRIKCSGRVGGRSKKAQRSKTQSAKIGQSSLGVFSSKIDFACKSAYTRFGLIGVKVWVCYQ